MSKKHVISLSLTTEYDRRLDEIAREHADLIGSTLNGTPNRSAIVRAMIDVYDSALLRDHLLRQRSEQQAA